MLGQCIDITSSKFLTEGKEERCAELYRANSSQRKDSRHSELALLREDSG